ncbi:MAG TPA: ABC transporter ATP-binding protein [bacterium]|nr:ABC transporter ATP-binding protein [bacterium]HEX68249.1 ABC transporter ATP-binding protein [bacterium]
MLLETKNLTRYFGGVKAVDGVDIQVKEGSIKGIIGPNGAGKTTFFHLLSGHLPPQKGWIKFKGEIINHLPPFERARRGIGRVFQQPSPFENLTLIENILISLDISNSPSLFTSLLRLPSLGKSEKEKEKKAIEILHFLNLEKKLYHFPSSLTHFERRKMEIGRVLALNPSLLLLDEPTAGLSYREKEEIKKIILGLKEKGLTILVVEHDMELITDICEEVVVLNFGKKIAEGSPWEIKNNPLVKEVYLGEEYASGS